MCLGIPGQIIEIVDAEKQLARAEVLGTTRTISMALLAPDEAQVGAWVLMHAGLAIRHIEESQAAQLLQLIKELDQAFEEEQV